MGKTSTAVKRRYNAKTYERIVLDVPKGTKETWKAHAESKGKSLTRFVHDLVAAEIKKGL